MASLPCVSGSTGYGDFKLIVPGPRPLPPQLFDLSKDRSESANLANLPTHADVVGTLRRFLDEWWTGVGDNGVTPDLQRLVLVLEALPDAALLAQLEERRERGRDDCSSNVAGGGRRASARVRR